MEIPSLYALSKEDRKKFVCAKARSEPHGFLLERSEMFKNPSLFLPLACEIGDWKSIQGLLAKGAVLSYKNNQPLKNLSIRGHFEILNKLFDQGFIKDNMSCITNHALKKIKDPEAFSLLKKFPPEEIKRSLQGEMGEKMIRGGWSRHLGHCLELSSLMLLIIKKELEKYIGNIPDHMIDFYFTLLKNSSFSPDPNKNPSILSMIERVAHNSRWSKKVSPRYLEHPDFIALPKDKQNLAFCHILNNCNDPLLRQWEKLYEEKRLKSFEIPKELLSPLVLENLLKNARGHSFKIILDLCPMEDILEIFGDKKRLISFHVFISIDEVFGHYPKSLSPQVALRIKEVLPSECKNFHIAATRVLMEQNIQNTSQSSSRKTKL